MTPWRCHPGRASGVAAGWCPDADPRSGGTAAVRWWDGERRTGHLGGPGGGPTYGQDLRATTPREPAGTLLWSAIGDRLAVQ